MANARKKTLVLRWRPEENGLLVQGAHLRIDLTNPDEPDRKITLVVAMDDVAHLAGRISHHALEA